MLCNWNNLPNFTLDVIWICTYTVNGTKSLWKSPMRIKSGKNFSQSFIVRNCNILWQQMVSNHFTCFKYIFTNCGAAKSTKSGDCVIFRFGCPPPYCHSHSDFNTKQLTKVSDLPLNVRPQTIAYSQRRVNRLSLVLPPPHFAVHSLFKIPLRHY